MGRKGQQSKRGIGEIDLLPRDKSLFFKVTKEDYLLLSAAAEKQNKTKTDVLIQLIRKHLSKYARYTTHNQDETLS